MTDSDVKNNRNSFLTSPEENNIVKNFIKKRHFLPNRNTVVGFDGVDPVESKIKSTIMPIGWTNNTSTKNRVTCSKLLELI